MLKQSRDNDKILIPLVLSQVKQNSFIIILFRILYILGREGTDIYHNSIYNVCKYYFVESFGVSVGKMVSWDTIQQQSYYNIEKVFVF